MARVRGCGIFGFCLLSFPQNRRKIYKPRQLSLSQFVYFLTTEPSMFTFSKSLLHTKCFLYRWLCAQKICSFSGDKNQIFRTLVLLETKMTMFLLQKDFQPYFNLLLFNLTSFFLHMYILARVLLLLILLQLLHY